MNNELTFDMLINEIKNNGKNYDLQKIQEAYELAEAAHKGQNRKSGEPYISHPIAVAHILLDLCMDTDTIVAGLLHDVVEDTDITLNTLSSLFGEAVSVLVDGVTKIRKINLKNPQKQEQENTDKIEFSPLSDKEQEKAAEIRKILVAMNNDIRVIIIKLADRLHNMRTLSSLRQEKQIRIAHETMTFYAPIAHQLGIAKIKDELENVSLFYLDQYAYKEIERRLEEQKQWREDFIQKITKRIGERLSDMESPPVIQGRVKGIYSLYKKWYITGKSLKEIYDVYAIRVIVDSTADCYNVMGLIHEMFTPLPLRFKDYIASPKENGYQSLHTTVLGKEEQPFEVQIRTHEMHSTARFGIAAHWRYKLGYTPKKEEVEAPDAKKRFDLIRQLLEQQQHTDDVEQLAEVIKTDLSSDEVRAFTPKGDFKSLPNGSTVVDFAYAIHTQIGNKMTGARVHGKIVSFDYVLRMGDLVEIQINDSPDYGPNRSWLDYAKMNVTKSKIRNWLKHERNEENIESGKEYIKSVLARYGANFDINTPDNIRRLTVIARKCRFHHLDDFYEAIGYGGVERSEVAFLIENEFKGAAPPQFSRELFTASVKLELELSSAEGLKKVMSSLNKIEGVIGIERLDK